MHKLSITSLVQPLWRSIAILGLGLPLAIFPTPAQALPEAQIVAKLQKIPVFTITNKTGNFYQRSAGTAGKNQLITPVFMELKDAVSFLKKIQKDQPQANKVAQVTIVPLSEVYKIQLKAKQQSANMSFVFVPTEQQLKGALTILNKPYQKNTGYPVPLFVIAIPQKDRYAAIQIDSMTSLFFDKQEAERSLSLFKQKEPKLAAKAKLIVNFLPTLLEDFAGRNYPGQEQLVLIPSPESRESVRKLQAAQSKPSAKPTGGTPKK
jgi:hypothetical protein